MDIVKLWLDLFDDLKIEFISSEEKRMIIDLFIDNKIDIQKFCSNILVLDGYDQYLLNESKLKPTETIYKFVSIANRPFSPIRFIAGFPDVIDWYNKERFVNKTIDDNYIKDSIGDYIKEKDSIKDYIKKKKNSNQSDLLAVIVPGFLVDLYRKKTSKKLELGVEFENDIYLGKDLFNNVGTDNNYIFIAENTMKIYLILERLLNNKPYNKRSLFIIAGVFDAKYYIFNKRSFSVDSIVDMAKDLDFSVDSDIADFFINLASIILKVDVPSIDISMIRKVGQEQKESIIDVINRLKSGYNSGYISENMIEPSVRKFINSVEYKECIEKLGI